MITVRPLNSTARPEVASATARASLGLAAGGDLLAVAGDDEQRVVDRHADADHRRHVGHEDRHLHHLREREDQRAGDEHRDERRARAAARRRRASRTRTAGSAARPGSRPTPPWRGPPWRAPASPAHSAPWPTRCVVDAVARAVGDRRAGRAGRRPPRWRRPRRPRRAAGRRPCRRRAPARAPASRASAASETPSTGPAAAATRSTAAPSCSGAGAGRRDEHRGELAPGRRPGSARARRRPRPTASRARRSRRWRGPRTGARRTAPRRGRSAAQTIRTARLRRRSRRSRRSMADCIGELRGGTWLAGQPKIRERRTAVCATGAHTAVASGDQETVIVPFMNGVHRADERVAPGRRERHRRGGRERRRAVGVQDARVDEAVAVARRRVDRRARRAGRTGRRTARRARCPAAPGAKKASASAVTYASGPNTTLWISVESAENLNSTALPAVTVRAVGKNARLATSPASLPACTTFPVGTTAASCLALATVAFACLATLRFSLAFDGTLPRLPTTLTRARPCPGGSCSRTGSCPSSGTRRRSRAAGPGPGRCPSRGASCR